MKNPLMLVSRRIHKFHDKRIRKNERVRGGIGLPPRTSFFYLSR